MEDNKLLFDWRYTNQDRYLKGKVLHSSKYEKSKNSANYYYGKKEDGLCRHYGAFLDAPTQCLRVVSLKQHGISEVSK